jgi:hypothetical protein
MDGGAVEKVLGFEPKPKTTTEVSTHDVKTFSPMAQRSAQAVLEDFSLEDLEAVIILGKKAGNKRDWIFNWSKGMDIFEACGRLDLIKKRLLEVYDEALLSETLDD